MKKVKVIVEWVSDGGIGAIMRDEMFTGMGETAEAAVNDLRRSVAFFIETAKEKGFPYKPYLDGEFDIEPDYDAVSMLKYARAYMKATKLAELIGVPAVQLGRYANDKAKPRAEQKRELVTGSRKFAMPFSAITL